MELDTTNQQTPPVQNPPQNKTSESIINNQRGNFPLIIGGIILLLIVGVGAFALGKRTNDNKFTNSTQQPQATISDTVSQPSLTSAPVSSPDVIPQENVFYFDTYEGEKIIFFTNKQEQKYFDPGAIEKTSPYIGSLLRATGGGNKPFDYKKLTNPRRIALNITSQIQAIDSLKLNSAKTMLYVSLNLEEKTSSQYPDNLVNKVYQVNLSNLSSKEIWSNEVGSNKYAGKGAVYIDQIAEDKFVAMMLGDCYACGGHPPTKTIIVNIATKNEKYLDGVGDLQFNLKDNTVYYKKLSPVQEACEPSPGCDNGQRTVMKPDGQIYTEKLP